MVEGLLRMTRQEFTFLVLNRFRPGVARAERVMFSKAWPNWLASGLAVLLLALLPPAHALEADDFPMPRQDFIVMEARAEAYGFRFEDLVVIDPYDGGVLKVLPMSPRLSDSLHLRPTD
ncbi:hypothetical protein RZS08_25230, partial [Arthrospira platensis SPKY1]|nr:hypothetical protein [Arthrospira platensis SPKY1]